MFKDNLKTKFLLFYFVIIYVFAFMFWWSYLLYKQTQQHYSDAINYGILEYKTNHNGKTADFYKTAYYSALENKFKRQRIMIITEGSVFFVILLVGMIKVRQSFQKEIEIARQQKNFILSITHELKSPLSGIKLMNETLRIRELNKDQQKQLLTNSLSEVDRLENLVENVLIAAKLENHYGFSKEPISLSQICQSIYTNYKSREDIHLTATIEEGIIINGDKTCLQSILSNLIDNAIKYAENTAVKIELAKKNKYIELIVSDQGKGIPQEEREKVFEKFYRIGNEETRSSKGTGLGLHIVKQLVEFHQGKIQIEDNLPKGSRFIIQFSV